jgi:hypothetical protein
MDKQTRIGLGGAALFTVAGIAAPILTWWVSGPIMIACAAVAVWGFWPFVESANVSPFHSKISLREAAAKLYAELRGTDVGRLMEGPPGASADNILDSAAHHVLQYAPLEVKRPPSTKWEPLPEEEKGKGRLMSRDGASALSYIESHGIRYTEPRLRRRDLMRLIREYKAEARPDRK